MNQSMPGRPHRPLGRRGATALLGAVVASLAITPLLSSDAAASNDAVPCGDGYYYMEDITDTLDGAPLVSQYVEELLDPITGTALEEAVRVYAAVDAATSALTDVTWTILQQVGVGQPYLACDEGQIVFMTPTTPLDVPPVFETVEEESAVFAAAAAAEHAAFVAANHGDDYHSRNYRHLGSYTARYTGYGTRVDIQYSWFRTQKKWNLNGTASYTYVLVMGSDYATPTGWRDMDAVRVGSNTYKSRDQGYEWWRVSPGGTITRSPCSSTTVGISYVAYVESTFEGCDKLQPYKSTIGGHYHLTWYSLTGGTKGTRELSSAISINRNSKPTLYVFGWGRA